MSREQIQSSSNAGASRVAFSSLIAIVGAAFVVQGVNLQGVIWFFLTGILAGTVLQGGTDLTNRECVKLSAVVASFFIVTELTLYILLGKGLSGYHDARTSDGVDITGVIRRLHAVIDSGMIWLYAGLWLAVALLIALSGIAAAYTVTILTRLWELDAAHVKSVKTKLTVATTIGTLITGFVAYFAAR